MKTNKRLCAAALAVALTLLLALPALAHRVNIFAYTEGDKIFVECSYSKSSRVHAGAITVLNAKTGEELLAGTTDDEGNFSFPIPQEAASQRADLIIRLKAGEGHQNDWTLSADEYLPSTEGATGSETAAQATDTPAPIVPGLTVSDQGGAAAKPADLNDAQLAALVQQAVEKAVEKKIAPLRQMLIDQESGPGMTEILGGIGWIFGLFGVAAYFKSRKG